MPHSQGLSSNPYPGPNQSNTYFFKIHSNIVLSLHRDFFPVGLTAKILKAFLPFSVLSKCPAHLRNNYPDCT